MQMICRIKLRLKSSIVIKTKVDNIMGLLKRYCDHLRLDGRNPNYISVNKAKRKVLVRLAMTAASTEHLPKRFCVVTRKMPLHLGITRDVTKEEPYQTKNVI